MIEIGNKHTSNIAVYLDRQDAIDLAYCMGPGDKFADDLLEAVKQAYPTGDDEDD